MPLEEYRAKRDFARTPEPAGGGTDDGGRVFVVHKHAARALHYDVRLEHGGVLLSWAVPKGPSLDPHEKHLAVHVEDHPLEYAPFEGTIPQGEYGGGTVMVWDRGTWEPLGDVDAMLAKGDLKVRFRGQKLDGTWVFVRMKPRPNEKRDNWLLIKERDGAERPAAEFDLLSLDRSAATGRTMEEIAAAGSGDEPPEEPALRDLPGFALATLTDHAPAGDEWLHEIKLDGYRAMLEFRNGHARFITRGGHDWSDRFAGLVQAAQALSVRDAVLDGEVCVVNAEGKTSFSALQRALSSRSSEPLVYFAFDLIALDGHDLRHEPLVDRKAALASLLGALPPGSSIRYLDHVAGQGESFHAQTCDFALEGSISKRADGPYRSGRTRDWLKVKCLARQEFVVAGWTDGTGSREGFGALVLGVHDSDGRLIHAGRVGTGFTEEDLRTVRVRLDALAAGESPFAEPPGGASVRGVHWVRPELVTEVAFTEWTPDGVLRQPVFLGLREDKPAALVVREDAEPDADDPLLQSAETTADASGPDAPRLTNPTRVLWETDGLTKADLATYYEVVAEAALPHIAGRLLSLVRCPKGTSTKCFYQKHADRAFPASVRRVTVPTREGDKEYLAVDDIEGILGLVQLGVLEIHTWGSRADDFEHPDRLTFDLDPGPGVEWDDVVRAAELVRDTLSGIGLIAFAKTTGGKGVHIVSPIVPGPSWDEARAFARSVAEAIAQARPEAYTSKMSKAERPGRVFIDYVRNNREATAIAAFSPRAREGAPVSTPVTWDELARGIDPGSLTMRTVPERVARLRDDPWEGYANAARLLPGAVR
ncbi:MAG: DNA ligase D [Coriobacteriia bacterium]